MGKSKGKGTPRTPALPANKERPRAPFTPSEPDNMLVILFSKLDLESSWCITEIAKEDHLTLLKQVRHYETMTVNEVFTGNQARGKKYNINELLNPSALARLEQIEIDDRDEIARLRITGEKRLYGFLEGNRFYALWWDPHHQIWPSRLKHT